MSLEIPKQIQIRSSQTRFFSVIHIKSGIMTDKFDLWPILNLCIQNVSTVSFPVYKLFRTKHWNPDSFLQ